MGPRRGRGGGRVAGRSSDEGRTRPFLTSDAETARRARPLAVTRPTFGEMERLAELIQESLLAHPQLSVLDGAGIWVRVRYSYNAVWMEVGATVAAALALPQWWDVQRGSRKDHAAWVARRLIAEWKEGRHEPGDAGV